MSNNYNFYKSIFSKGDKANYLYDKKDIQKLNNQEKKFLDGLIIFSKHKNKIKNYFEKYVSFRDVNFYLDVNQNYLSYDEYIKFETIKVEYKNTVKNLFSTCSFLFIFTTFYNIYRRPTGYNYIYDLKYSFGISFTIFLTYLCYYRCFYYKEDLKNIYLKLSEKLYNSNHKESIKNYRNDYISNIYEDKDQEEDEDEVNIQDFKKLNYLEEDSKANYFMMYK